MKFYRILLCCTVVLFFNGCGGDVNPSTSNIQVVTVDGEKANPPFLRLNLLESQRLCILAVANPEANEAKPLHPIGIDLKVFARWLDGAVDANYCKQPQGLSKLMCAPLEFLGFAASVRNNQEMIHINRQLIIWHVIEWERKYSDQLIDVETGAYELLVQAAAYFKRYPESASGELQPASCQPISNHKEQSSNEGNAYFISAPSSSH